MKFEVGDLIEEIVDGQPDGRFIVLKRDNHPVVFGRGGDYTLYLLWASPSQRPRHSPG